MQTHSMNVSEKFLTIYRIENGAIISLDFILNLVLGIKQAIDNFILK